MDKLSLNMDRRQFMGAAAALTAAAIAGDMVLAGNDAQAQEAVKDARRHIATFVADVTLPLGTPIYSSFKPLSIIETPLLAKGVVLEDAGGRYVLCAVDWCELCNSTYHLFRNKIAEAAGIVPDHVAVQTVHQHTAPISDADAELFSDKLPSAPPHPTQEVYEEAANHVAAAVKEALTRLQPYDRIGASQAVVERVASNRRVLIDGKIVTRYSSCTDPKLIEAPEGLIDPHLKTITFALGDKPLARLHYYATHPQSFYGDPRASYDFVGMARERLQQKEAVFQVYFTGCSGDIAAGKYNDHTTQAREGLYQRILAAMEASVSNAAFQPAQDVVWTNYPLKLTPRNDATHTEAELTAQMNNAAALPSVRLTAAGELIYKKMSANPIMLSSLRIGDVCIIHLPGEPAIEFQLYAQQAAPKSFVAVAGYGDCAMGYICMERFFAEGGYEATATNAAPESEAAVKAGIDKLLNG